MVSIARLALLLAWLVASAAGSAHAHPLAPSLLEIIERAPGQAEVQWKTPSTRVPGADLRPLLPAQCRATSRSGPEAVATALVERRQITCATPLEGSTVEVAGIAGSGADVILRVALADGRHFSTVLTPDSPSFMVPAQQPWPAVAQRYAALGFDHILSGYDHLLFVLGLLLLVRQPRQLVATVTAFTVGHSVTLSLAALGIVNVPSRLVEALIALSILFLAIELTRPAEAPPSPMQSFPWALTFAFGLLHGLGFAGALAEIGLPVGEIPLALFSFNLGIETGQLAFCAGLLVLYGAARCLPNVTFGRRGVTTAGYVIGSLASFWFVERLAAVW